ncbi:hypothetical protein C8R46DRAFT_1350153 [Mycena filopes]|nr:hypothetical protein C8R46DRAFT_1350151 [Mycena filopes]KAJ7168506.1 hypothetical protein C8R46DRAFT_1350153 [Mycena filopes]
MEGRLSMNFSTHLGSHVSFNKLNRTLSQGYVCILRASQPFRRELPNLYINVDDPTPPQTTTSETKGLGRVPYPTALFRSIQLTTLSAQNDARHSVVSIRGKPPCFESMLATP